MRYAYPRWRVARVRTLLWGRVDISVLAGGPRLRCGTSEREHVSRGEGGEGGARAVAARRGLVGQRRSSEWRDRADLHYW